MIEARGLTKKFDEFKAVDGLDLSLPPGICFGLLGPNGAGKSTMINMIYGNALRTSGDLKVFGLDPTTQSREIKKRLGVVTQDNALDESLSVVENMMLYAGFLGISYSERPARIEELLKYMNLAHKRDAKIQTLSGGMRRRLVFVRALLGQPELLILDEPTTGLDPAVRHLLWGKVKELKAEGVTLLLTTHYMHEAEILCDRVAVMNKGKILSIGTPKELIQQHTPGYVGVYSLDPEVEAWIGEVKREGKVLYHAKDSSGLYIRMPTLESLVALRQQNPKFDPLQIRPANLEDVFLKLTGQELALND